MSMHTIRFLILAAISYFAVDVLFTSVNRVTDNAITQKVSLVERIGNTHNATEL